MPVDGMSHPEFISFTAAWKQAAWTVLDHNEMWFLFLQWCERFGEHSKGIEHNLKHWNSINDTELGWKSLLRQNAALNGAFMFYGSQHQPVAPMAEASPIPAQELPQVAKGLMLAEDYAEYFKGCVFVVREQKILTPNGQMMNQTQFNGDYGGPRFVINPQGAPSKNAWEAATVSSFKRIDSVSRLRFHPAFDYGDIIDDDNRLLPKGTQDKSKVRGLNVFKKHEFQTSSEDVTPFLNHMAKLLPVESDREILFDFLAHNAKYPGHKIPWAPLLQSAEGAGKGVIKHILRYVVGGKYFHSPNAKELAESGSKFNGWMRRKTFLFVDEVKTDEKRQLIEIFKPWITEAEIEIQGKGQDQDKEDNYSNWAFFSNHKDAIPIDDDSRRFAIFYSAIQSAEDKERAGMDSNYFRRFYDWLGTDSAGGFTHCRGLKAIAGWLMQRNVAKGGLPGHAPVTSSHAEAVEFGRGPLAQVLAEAVEAEDVGFKGGWIHSGAASAAWVAAGMRPPAPATFKTILHKMGYHKIRKTQQTWPQVAEGRRGTLYHRNKNADWGSFAFDQGVEVRGNVSQFPQPGVIPIAGRIPGQMPPH